MHIAESARVTMQQFIKPGAVSASRPASDVSREERLQLLTGKQPAQSAHTMPGTYSERAQLLATSGSPRHSWLV